MNQAIVYKNDEGGISVIHPSPKVLQGSVKVNGNMEGPYTIQQIARKDVPAGKPYAIVDINELPADRVFRGAWDIDDGELVDGTGNTTNAWE